MAENSNSEESLSLAGLQRLGFMCTLSKSSVFTVYFPFLKEIEIGLKLMISKYLEKIV